MIGCFYLKYLGKTTVTFGLVNFTQVVVQLFTKLKKDKTMTLKTTK